MFAKQIINFPGILKLPNQFSMYGLNRLQDLWISEYFSPEYNALLQPNGND